MSRTGSGFPFAAAVGFGMCELGLSPREIWGMSPRELAMAADFLTGGAGAGPQRADLQRLMRMFPDRGGSPG